MSGFGHRVYKNYDPRAKVIIAMHIFMVDALHFKSYINNIEQELQDQ